MFLKTYAIGLGVQAPTAKAPAVLTKVVEGMRITKEMVHHHGMNLSKQHTAGFTSFLLVQSDLTLSAYKQCSYLSIQLQGSYYGHTGMG